MAANEQEQLDQRIGAEVNSVERGKRRIVLRNELEGESDSGPRFSNSRLASYMLKIAPYDRRATIQGEATEDERE